VQKDLGWVQVVEDIFHCLAFVNMMMNIRFWKHRQNICCIITINIYKMPCRSSGCYLSGFTLEL